MRIKEAIKLDFNDVLIIPKRSAKASRKDVILERTYTFRNSGYSWTGVPIIASNMDTVGTISVARELEKIKCFTWLHKFYSWEVIQKGEINQGYFSPSIGESYLIMHSRLWDYPYVRIDVANGYREDFVNYVKKFRDCWRNATIFAGNVCTPEMTEQLILAGADVVVVGIGSGGQCTTRTKSGIGYPQLSAVIECADAAHGLKAHIASDGGCRTPGDVCKAFAAGADFVALGSMLAAHDENTDFKNIFCEQEDKNIYDKPKMFTYTYGMSSEEAMNKYYGGVAEHRTSEGKKTKLYMRGPILNTMQDILGGIRSCCTYVGASSLKELSKCTTFVKVNRTHNTYWKDENETYI